jgi:GT2 family glycosyltransferase
MVISYCIPIRNRAKDLKKCLPAVIQAAEYSSPVEIVIFDYGSTDDLARYIEGKPVRKISYPSPFFHMAHARNLAVLAATGEYVTSSNADTVMVQEFFAIVRDLIAKTGAEVVRARRGNFNGVMTMKKSAFIAAGGFDERFEFYGPEDRDLALRLQRRQVRHAYFDSQILDNLETRDHAKVQGYRLPLSKVDMTARMRLVLEDNIAKGQLVANEGVAWGVR